MSASRGIRRYRGWIAAGVLVAVAGTAFVLLRGGADAADTITYETEVAALGTISVTVAGTGNLEVDGTTEVYPAVAGTVASIAVAEGSVVATGDVLFTLDEATAEANSAKTLASLRQSEQGVAQAQAQVTKAQATLATLKARSTEPTPTATAADVAAAEGDVTVAKAGLASANAQRASAEHSYQAAADAEDDLVVTAPCGGVVYALGAAVGDSVAASSGSSSSATSANSTGGMTDTTSAAASSSAPVTLAPEQPLAVHLTVNEVDLPSLEIGQRADIEFDAFPDLTATGKVYEIADVGSNSSGVVTFDVWVSVDVADPALRSGMSAAATIVTDVARNTLIVPNSAVQADGNGGYYVQVLVSGATEPTQVTVETGLASATQTQMLSGISEGDIVVTQTVDSTEDATSAGTGGGMMIPGMGGGPRE
jgi:macrolide-specific efflux system membrane fusion protein